MSRERVVYCVTTLPSAPVRGSWTRRLVITGLILLAILVALYIIGDHALAAQAAAAHTTGPGCIPDPPTGTHMTFNKCALLDASQVQDRR